MQRRIGDEPVERPEPDRRLLSLDVVRGITIAFMIMVNNNGGSGSWGFMNHADWNGLTATDLVFPTFVFVMGASVVFAIESRLARGLDPGAADTPHGAAGRDPVPAGHRGQQLSVLRADHMRFYGVLQRIAVCYLAVSLLYLWTNRVWPIATALVIALVGYWVLLRWVPVPGAGLPGRDVPFMDMRQNLVSWIDRQLFPYHLYRDLPDHNVRDPEGPAERPAGHRHRADGHADRHLAALAPIGSGQDAGPGSGRHREPGAGLSVGALVSAEQEHVDQLLCAGGGRLRAGAGDVRVLGCRGEGVADGLDLGMARLRLECDCRVHVQRAAPGRPAEHPLHRRRASGPT